MDENIQNEFRTVVKHTPIMDIALAQIFELELGLPMGSKENIEQVVFTLQYRSEQIRDALSLLDETKHFHVVKKLQFLLENCFEPALEHARQQLDQVEQNENG